MALATTPSCSRFACSSRLQLPPKILAVFTVVAGQRRPAQSTVLCSPIGDPPLPRQLRTTFRRARHPWQPDTVLEYMARYTVAETNSSWDVSRLISRDKPSNDAYLNVLGVVDTLSRDLIQMMLMRRVTWKFVNLNKAGRRVGTPDVVYLSWDPKPDNRSPSDISRLGSYVTTSGATTYKNNSYSEGMNTTMVNLFIALRDAMHIDLGYQNLQSKNIYANKELFNTLIRPDPLFPELVSLVNDHNLNIKGWRTTSWGWGAVPNASISWAQVLTSSNPPRNGLTLPINATAQPASVLDLIYLCPQYKMKSPGSLFAAVFIGTVTMYLTVCGAFSWAAGTIDRKHHGPYYFKPPTEDSDLSSFEIGKLLKALRDNDDHSESSVNVGEYVIKRTKPPAV